MVYKFSHVFVLATFTIIGTVVATEIDTEKNKPKQLVGTPPQEQPARQPEQSIMKEPSSMAWIVLAGLIGGFVSPGLIRTKTWSQASSYSRFPTVLAGFPCPSNSAASTFHRGQVRLIPYLAGSLWASRSF